jgi:coenzyme F420-reducing hydrogenase delta subunit/ferredoxin
MPTSAPADSLQPPFPHLARMLSHCEAALDSCFGAGSNPLRHLGALGFFFFWVLAASGIYLYIVMDTSVAASYASIAELAGRTPGGLIRSLHRYAADAFLLVMVLHLLREWALGRYRGFRWYSWVSGVPLLALALAAAIGGYWLPWDTQAQYSAIVSSEWLDWLPLFGEPIARNFLSPETVTDRLFTLLIFLHLGLPLLTLIGAWAHVHRISRVDHFPQRALAIGCTLALVALAVLQPAESGPAADLRQEPASLALDWIVLGLNPLSVELGAGPSWALVALAALVLTALPWLGTRPRVIAACVDAPNCNGCRRCYEDCPYGAVRMLPHPKKSRREIAVVDADFCAVCGICVGACPSSTPFRRQETLVTGIDLPDSPINDWRQRLERWLDTSSATDTPRLVVFGCDQEVSLATLDPAGAEHDTLYLSLRCAAMLPPAFVEYALRAGADGVVVSGCSPGGCHFRLGSQWQGDRLDGTRAPELRASAPRERLHICWADRHDSTRLAREIAGFRKRLHVFAPMTESTVFHRRPSTHVHPTA